MKVTIAKNYDWPVPGKRAWVSFKAGWTGRVTRAQGAEIITAGVGREVKTRRG